MSTVAIAWRNIFRNARRSLLTLTAISIGAVAVLLFGGFVTTIVFGFQTEVVRKTGHVLVYRQGYFEFGAGRPGDYGIADPAGLIGLIKADPALGPLVRVAAPSLHLNGIAGNFARNTSKTFVGFGVVPSARAAMMGWDGFGLGAGRSISTALSDGDREGGVVGIGLARMLQLCTALAVPECRDAPDRVQPVLADVPAEDFSSLIERDPVASDGGEAGGSGSAGAAGADVGGFGEGGVGTGAGAPPRDPRPRIELLAATAGGAPNVIGLHLIRAERQGVKEIDDNFVMMHLELAQRLLFGRGEPMATAVHIQLQRSEDLEVARGRLKALFATHNLDLETRSFTDVTPMYGQVIGMFGAIFGFISMVMGVIVLFTVGNTMAMGVMERINEIGTLRALGLRRSGVRRLFLSEGVLLGVLGATIGTLIGIAIAAGINAAHLTWLPPSNVEPVPLRILVLHNPPLLVGCWVILVALSALSSVLPAIKAARLLVVDALRHV